MGENGEKRVALVGARVNGIIRKTASAHPHGSDTFPSWLLDTDWYY